VETWLIDNIRRVEGGGVDIYLASLPKTIEVVKKRSYPRGLY